MRNSRKGRGGGGTQVTRTERKTDGGIMRGQAGSENNKQEKAERRGDGARFVGDGPGGRAREERRPKDHCSAWAAITATGSPALASRKQCTHAKTLCMCTYQHAALHRGVKRGLEYQVQELLLKIFNCKHNKYDFVVTVREEKTSTSPGTSYYIF